MERKVNLFLVGAMKAGTTMLMDLLSQHPEIYASPIKEPNFFVSNPPKELYDPSRFFSLRKYFDQDFPKPLHIANIDSLDDYNKLFSMASNEMFLLDGSTMYLHAPETAQKIYDYNKNACIIIIKREPLSRAYSHYNMLSGLSRELKSFEVRLNNELQSYESNSLDWYSCLGMSLYSEAINNFERLFQNVICVDFETLSNTPKIALESIYKSLDLQPVTIKKISKSNVGRELKFRSFFFFLKKLGVKDVFSKIFPTKFKKWLFNKVSSKKRQDIPLSPATKLRVMQIFKKQSL